MEENIKKFVETNMGNLGDELEAKLDDKEDRSRRFLMEKLEEIAILIRQEQIHQDQRIEAIVHKVLTKELTTKYFTREVMKSAASMSRGSATTLSQEEFEKEERRVVKNLRSKANSIKAIKEMSKKLKKQNKKE